MSPPRPPSSSPGTTRPVLLTTQLIGDVNRSRVLQAFVDHGPLSRAALARLAHVPRATIGAIVQGLMEGGLLDELEPDRTAGRVGKPGRPLWFGRQAGQTAAAVFDETGVRAALVNARGDRLATGRVDLALRTAAADQVLNAVAEALRQVLPQGRAVAQPPGVLGIGVAVPGVCDTANGVVLGSGQVPGAAGDGLARGLAAMFELPVLVDNDARVQALGEKWFGDGRGVETFASVQTGSGLGVGLVLGGSLFRGADGATGELGHTQVVPNGEKCRCGLSGCWETIATLRWLRAEAERRGLPDPETLDSARLVALATAGNEEADELLDLYAAHLSVGLSTLVNLLGTHRLLLHGDVIGGGEVLRSRLEAATRERSLGYLSDLVELTFSSLDADAGLLGAAGLVLSETFRLAV